MYPEVLVNFFESYPEIHYKHGEKILRPNEYLDQVYFVKKGLVRFYKVFPSGQEMTINSTNPKTQKYIIFGYTHLLSNYHIDAFTDVVVHRAPKAAFETLANEHPEVKDEMINELKLRFEEVSYQIEWLSIPDSYTRIKAVLYHLARLVGVEKDSKVYIYSPDSSVRFTHHLFASMAGLSRETVTIQINKLFAEGYIARENGSFVIQRIADLRNDIP